MTEQNTLPFEPITDMASRDTTRLILKRSGEIFKIDINKVQFRPGIQPRYKPDWMDYDTWYNKELAIPELAGLLAARGQEEPIEGDLTTEGIFYVTKGHRRTMAMQWLLEHNPDGAAQFMEEFKGETLCMIKVIRNHTDLTDLQRLIRTTSENEQLKLKPLELAKRVLEVKKSKEGGEYTNDELKDIYGKSRQWVDNQINLATLPEDLKIKVEKEEVTPTQALAVKREEKKTKKEEEKLPLPEEDNKGYIITSNAKAIIEDISKSFLCAPKWQDARIKLMKRIGINEVPLFYDWCNAFTRSIRQMNATYETTIHDFMNDFKAWIADEDLAANPNEMHLYVKEDEGDPAVFDSTKAEGFSDEPPQSVEGEITLHNTYINDVGEVCHGIAPVKYDKDSIHGQDDGLLKGTDPNYKEIRPKKNQDGDALGAIDFKKEKTEAEMNLTEAIKNADKVYVNLGHLPAAQKQFIEDNQRLIHFMIEKMKLAIETIKKAADKR